MTLTDKNKIFFALIHYILVEQRNVDWILKTILIDFTGISSLLEERPYKTDSTLDDVVDMITQIKPYHVQFSHYFEHYQTHQEAVDVNVISDIFFFPLRVKHSLNRRIAGRSRCTRLCGRR